MIMGMKIVPGSRAGGQGDRLSSMVRHHDIVLSAGTRRATALFTSSLK